MAHVEFVDLKIENISNVSGVFTGNNIHVRWKSYPRVNEGYGKINGDSNRYVNNKSIIIEKKVNLEDK